MSCRLTILASGSGGNCAYLETGSTRLLVDAGLSLKQIEERLGSIGQKASDLRAVLITHEHSDHIDGLSLLVRRYHVPIYANHNTRAAILESWKTAGKTSTATSPVENHAGPGNVGWRVFEPGQRFTIGDFDVEPFSIPHDASDPVGFLFHHGGRRIVFITDVGHMNHLILEKMRHADVLVLETNHDLDLLQKDTLRPWPVKQRVAGKHGHLSNKDAAAAISEVISDRLQHVFLAHLSQDCNRPELAEATIRRMLNEMGSSHVKVTLTWQDRPCQTYELEPARPLSAETPSLFDQPRTR